MKREKHHWAGATRDGRRTTPPPTAKSVPTVLALDALIDETRLLFHRLRAAAEQVHGQGKMSGGLRGVLRDLACYGPQTVPQMARRRPVARQHIQVLVNQLAAKGLVEPIENPAHKRSRLVQLTPQGKELIEGMRRREARILGSLKIEIPVKDLHNAAAVLCAVRTLLDGAQWWRAVKSAG